MNPIIINVMYLNTFLEGYDDMFTSLFYDLLLQLFSLLFLLQVSKFLENNRCMLIV